MRKHMARRGALLGVATAVAVLGTGVGGATAAPSGCPPYDVSAGPMYWDYISSYYVGPGYLQRSYKEYYNGRYLGWTSCRA